MPIARRWTSRNGSAAQIRAARGEQGRLKRIKSAIPIVARRRRLLQDLDELGDVIRLRDDFGAEFRGAQDQLRLAEQTIDQTRAAIAEIDAQLAQLDPPQVLLDAADEIGSLRERLGAVEKANEDREQRLERFLRDCRARGAAPAPRAGPAGRSGRGRDAPAPRRRAGDHPPAGSAIRRAARAGRGGTADDRPAR